ncbi:SWIM zinc finger family protein [Streptomyces auratus]|uniref:SWIM zinc finger family protein n=1 Tax=Streptomyces auratus AGR0001 TaxID=1160718 RepID=J1RJA0_9ACTN|nr:SWIM zinc finger family protein [Streptomyces auratus]QTZ91382.1 SWIM zinc finger family protein [Streptomyces auratus AGR0001]
MNPRPASGRAAAADRLARADRSRTFPPLPVRTGARGLFAESWWGSAWLDALETTALDSARLARGRTYARDGHVDTINVTPGRIVATVRGSRPRPYSAEIRLRTLTDQEWDGLLDAIAAEPGRLTALLAKKLPPALAEGEVRLLPGPGDLVPRCSCPDHGRPCKHAAALCFQVARLLDADPFVLLLMRGRGERELLDALSRRNAALTAREARDHAPAADRPAPYRRGPGAGGGPQAADAEQGSAAASVGAPGEVAFGGVPGEQPAPAETRSRGVQARLALSDRPRPPLPPPLPLPPQPGRPSALPDGDGLPFDPATLEFLAADAAARAHACVSAGRTPGPGAGHTAGHSPFPALPPWEDAIRLTATAHPTAGLTATTRVLYRDLAAATGRTATDVARAVAAWRQGGPEGLVLLDTPWNPPAGDFDRARSALLAADLPSLRPRHNHLTDPDRGIQLRFGHDHRWYPYESEPGAEDWWPAGPADPDPVGALTTLLAR